jgi:hypothetical protein
MASDIISHTSLSCALIVATCSISSLVFMNLVFFSSSCSTASHALFIQFFSSIALIHDLISRSHSLIIA